MRFLSGIVLLISDRLQLWYPLPPTFSYGHHGECQVTDRPVPCHGWHKYHHGKHGYSPTASCSNSKAKTLPNCGYKRLQHAEFHQTSLVVPYSMWSIQKSHIRNSLIAYNAYVSFRMYLSVPIFRSVSWLQELQWLHVCHVPWRRHPFRHDVSSPLQHKQGQCRHGCIIVSKHLPYLSKSQLPAYRN